MAGEELIDREPAHGHHQRDGKPPHTVGSPHPVIPFGAEIIAVDGLGAEDTPTNMAWAIWYTFITMP